MTTLEGGPACHPVALASREGTDLSSHKVGWSTERSFHTEGSCGVFVDHLDDTCGGLGGAVLDLKG